MKILCPECSASYDLPISLLGAGRRMRCANCGHIWMQEPVQPSSGGYGYSAPPPEDDDIDPIPASVHPHDERDDSAADDVERGPGFFADVNWKLLGRMVAGFVLAWVLIYALIFGMLAGGVLPGALTPLARGMGLNAGLSLAGLEVKNVAAASNGKTTSVTGKLFNSGTQGRIIPLIELTPVLADGDTGDSKTIKPEQDMLKAGETVDFKADMGVKLDAGAGVRVRLLGE